MLVVLYMMFTMLVASCAVHEVFYRASCAVSEVCFLFSFFRIFQFLDFRFRVPVYIGGRSSLNMIKENINDYRVPVYIGGRSSLNMIKENIHDYIQSSNIHRRQVVLKHD